MLYVLLVLLKIIGIFLALLIGLIILILAVPVRYSFRFHIDENLPPGGQIKVTWLFCILYIKASYIDKLFDYRVRIFGYQIMGSQKEFLEKKQKRKERKQEKKKKKKEKQKQKEEKTEEESGDNPFLEDEETVKEDIRKTDDGTADMNSKNSGKKKPSIAKPKNKNTRKKGRIASLKKKIEGLKTAWREYNGKQLLDFTKAIIIKILRHVLPRKLRGYICFGFNDPAVTGIITGAAALFYPKYQNTFSLEPDFQRQCFTANCQGRGRIHLGFFVYIGITALLNRDVRNLIKKML